MDMILGILPGENYFDSCALMDIVSVCLHRCQQVLYTVAEERVVVIRRTRFVLVSFIYFLSMDTITPINQFAAPSGIHLEPSESLKPILTPGYELRPSLISLV
jgi:hypothetical protein